MRQLLIGSAFALLAATAAHATPADSGASKGMKLGQAECDALWMKANPTNADNIPEAAAQAYITDVKAANPDGDTTIEKDEFVNACNTGMIKSAMATGQQKSEAGSETSDRTPEASTPAPLSQTDSSDGKTSDRTPKN